MGLSRRNVLIGLGGIVAGGGALVGTGAFTTVQAERTVNVQTTGDASAFLALNEVPDSDNSEYIDTSGDTIVIDISSTSEGGEGLNQNAITTIRRIVQVTNNGTQQVGSLTLTMSDPNGRIDESATFYFTATDPESSNQATVDNGGDILGNEGLGIPLGAGDSIEFGMEIDLRNGGSDGDLPNGNYDLTITANTASS